MIRSRQLWLSLLLTGGLAIAQSPPPADPIAALTAEDLARGKRWFVSQCALCHGIEGAGGKAPALNQPILRRVADQQTLFDVIKKGIDRTEMPGAWFMTDREVWQVAGYVRSLGRIAAIKLPGDALRGQAVYETKSDCAACHIVRGRGKSLGPDLTDVGVRRSPAYLREALIDPAASVPPGFLVVTVVTRDGRKIRGLRVNEDSFTIQLRDAENHFHSFRKVDVADLKKEFGASTMPNYQRLLTISEIDDLVAYLAGLRGDP